MQFLTEILIISFIIFLYFLFSFAKEDFVLLRKNITLEQLFNIAVIGFFMSILFARIGYVAMHPSKYYLQPLVFLVFPYFPGLSLSVGMIGSIFYIWFMAHRKKFPFPKLMDIYATAFTLTLPFFSLLLFVAISVTTRHLQWILLIMAVLFAIAGSILSWISNKGTRKDGSIGALGIICISLIYSIGQIPLVHIKTFHLSTELSISIGLMIISGIFFLKQELLSKK